MEKLCQEVLDLQIMQTTDFITHSLIIVRTDRQVTGQQLEFLRLPQHCGSGNAAAMMIMKNKAKETRRVFSGSPPWHCANLLDVKINVLQRLANIQFAWSEETPTAFSFSPSTISSSLAATTETHKTTTLWDFFWIKSIAIPPRKAWNREERKRRTEFEMDGVYILEVENDIKNSPEPRTKVELCLQTSKENLVQRLAFLNKLGLDVFIKGREYRSTGNIQGFPTIISDQVQYFSSAKYKIKRKNYL